MDLTIVIPTHNRNNCVVECVLALDHNLADIVVVDDGSEHPVVLPPGTGRVIRHDRHCGRPAAVNSGLRAAWHDLVLIIDDNIFAAPDMVSRLVNQFTMHKNRKLGLTARVVWDPDVPLTLTMQWLEQINKFPAPILLWRPFVLEHGGYDENFTRGLDDVELHLRLKPQGFEVRSLESAVGFQNKMVKIRDLVELEFMEGVSAVYLHSKFPEHLPQVDDMELLFRNQLQSRDAEGAVEEISLLEQAESSKIPPGASDLFAHVCRYYFLHGVYERLQDIGGIKPKRPNSSTLAIYHQASHLESIGELDEARRLFQLVLHRSDEEYWHGAEYHLGCIETELGNESSAHSHFIECLKKNPGHNKARRALNKSPQYREVAPNVFETIAEWTAPKVLFILFGDLGDVINAFPVVAALREKFSSEIVWLTTQEYSALARASFADAVREAEPRGIIPWDWIHSESFTHVFYPEAGANQDEWQQSGMHPIDFMAVKCGVQLETHKSWLEPGPAAVSEAEQFLREFGLIRGAFITAAHVAGTNRHWPHSNLIKLADQIEMPVVVFGKKSDPELPGTIACFDRPFPVMAKLIEWSCCYIGPESGISWIATTTHTPMAVFMDPLRTEFNAGYSAVLREEKNDIQEWSIYTPLQTVLEHVRSKVLIETPVR